MEITAAHRQRIKQELIAAGVTPYGLMKNEARYLPNLIHKDEHIEAVAYGRYKNGSAMLVATDRRALFLDRKALITILDELTYEVVAGVTIEMHGPFANVNLHTRLGDYSVRLVNQNCAMKFIDYIERRRLEENVVSDNVERSRHELATMLNPVALGDEGRLFAAAHELGVLSTLDRRSNLCGAAVYYVLIEPFIYLITRSDSQKAHNIMAHNNVAFTIYDEPKLQMLQIQGMAEVETNEDNKKQVFNAILKPRYYEDGMRMPPVSQLSGGSFVVLKITPTNTKFTDFMKLGDYVQPTE